MIYQMFTLVTDRSKYFRVKRGQTQKETEEVLGAPFKVFFDGAIIELGKIAALYMPTSGKL